MRDGYSLILGDCFDAMRSIPDSGVDMILCDPPYGTMNTDGGRKIGINGWDKSLPTFEMYTEVSRVLRPNGMCILFAQEPYTTELITGSIPSLPFSYRAIWKKNSFGNCLGANKNMVNCYEDILIFSKVHPKHDFDCVHPLRSYSAKLFEFIGLSKKALIDTLGQRADHFFRFNSSQFSLCVESLYIDLIARFRIDEMPGFINYEDLQRIETEYRSRLIDEMNSRYPKAFNLWEGGKSKSNILEYEKDRDGFHPTQKPVLLLEDLIKTFSNVGDVVLDFTMGSGSTGVACVNTGRQFIRIEKEAAYFDIAEQRLRDAVCVKG